MHQTSHVCVNTAQVMCPPCITPHTSMLILPKLFNHHASHLTCLCSYWPSHVTTLHTTSFVCVDTAQFICPQCIKPHMSVLILPKSCDLNASHLICLCLYCPSNVTTMHQTSYVCFNTAQFMCPPCIKPHMCVFILHKSCAYHALHVICPW